MLKFSSILTSLICKTKFHNVSHNLARSPATKSVPNLNNMRKDIEYKIGKKYAIKNLEKLFNLKTAIAYKIVSENDRLCKVNSVLMNGNYLKCRKNGISDEILLKYPFLLAETELDLKIKLLAKLPFDINSVAVLLVLELEKLQDLLEKKGKSRIQIISELLNINEQDCCELLTERPFILTMPLEKLENNINLLKEYNILTEDIQKDLWVLRYSTKLIKERLDYAKMQKVEKMKTWMVRATPRIFEKYIQRRSDNKEILGNNSITEYLSERLQCNMEITKFLLSKYPALKHKSLRKIKEIIDFLFGKGFSPNHICRVPKILTHSIDTTKKRLKELENKNVQIESLYMLTKSQKQFKQYYEANINKKLKTKP